MNTILNELTTLFSHLPADAADRAVRIINAHERVFVYAAGRSGLMLRAFAMRLAQMGRTVYVVGETVTPAIGPGDLLVLASASGSTQSVCRYAQIAAEIGADLFTISANADSPLGKIHPPDILLRAGSKDDAGASTQVMGSLFEQALLLLCDHVISRFGENGAAMRGRHANLE